MLLGVAQKVGPACRAGPSPPQLELQAARKVPSGRRGLLTFTQSPCSLAIQQSTHSSRLRLSATDAPRRLITLRRHAQMPRLPCALHETANKSHLAVSALSAVSPGIVVLSPKTRLATKRYPTNNRRCCKTDRTMEPGQPDRFPMTTPSPPKGGKDASKLAWRRWRPWRPSQPFGRAVTDQPPKSLHLCAQILR
jgi:hypothetical protein